MVLRNLLLLLFTLVLYVDAQGNCDVTDPDYKDDWIHNEFWFNVNDTDTSYKVEITTDKITSVDLNHQYMKANVANDVLTITVKDEFKEFIQKEDKLETAIQSMSFTCQNGEGDNKYLTLNVTETQKFPPKFELPNYQFKLSVPISPNQIIESTAMIVTDYNIDEALTFSFTGGDPECMRYFDFSTIRSSKKYTTKLKTKEFVNLDKSITCNVNVKDKSNEADNTQLAIEVDVQNSKVPNPIFKDAIKVVDYGENLKVQLELLSSTYTPIPEIKGDNRFSKYFDKRVVANNIIEIELVQEIPEEELGNTNYFVLIVEVEYEKADNIGKTAVLVDLNRNTATTTTSTSTTPECTTTIISTTTPCDCTTTSPDPGSTSTSTISTTSETDTSSCPSCPDCTTTLDPGSTSTCPTTCPECPETSTLPGTGTTCPSCPETTTLPGTGTTCPTTCPECPETSTLPGEGTSCPECPTTCPSCPETTLPGGSTVCPEISTSPGEGTSCPECPTTCPTYPGESTTCPEISTSPGEGTSCPECPTTCPETTLPGGSTICPEITTLPGEGTSCPECPTICPTCPETTLPGGSTICPEITTLPGEGTNCPECPTTCPSCPLTTLPGESTTCPSNPECPSTSFDSTTSSLGSSTPPNCDCSTSSPTTTCAPCEPDPQVRFEKKSSFKTLDKGSTGYVETFKAVSDIRDEEIIYNIKSVKPTGAVDKFVFTENGDVNIKEELSEATYEISLTATGKQSKSQDEIMLFLLIGQTILNCDDNTIQVKRLINTYVKEGEEKKILDANGNHLEFTIDNEDILDWFKFNKNYDLEVLNIDREDKRIKSLLAPQIQVKIKATKIETPPQLRYNFSANSFSQYAVRDSQSGYSCLSIKNIGIEADTIIVLVNVEDVNDNPPIFVEKGPLVVGYPEAKLVEFIAPPYLVKVTATDEDFGDNAKIKYTTNNKNFIADAENGIIFLGNEITDNTEFKVIAEDNNGNGGNKAELSVKVKLLKQEHISVITIENIAYSEIEDKVKELSSLTKQTVKYLSSTALPKVTEDEKKMIRNMFKVYSNDEKVPAVRIILYALDNKNEIISAKDFKKIADDVDLGIKISVEEYTAASPNENQEDTTGWIAAVSTLSVLLALVIIGGLLGYIFYLRPRMMESPSDGYKKHTYRDSVQTSPVETKMESSTTLSDRRPTGFPTGFNPKDLDDDDEDSDYENVFEDKEKENTIYTEVVEEDEGINNSEVSSSAESEQKPKTKTGVKFDTNVTEIEIEEF